MAKVSTTGRTEKSMTASGKTVSKKDMACGKAYLAILTSDNGKTARLMVTEFISGKTVTDSKEAGLTVSNMAKALISLQTEMCTLATTPLENQKAKVCTSGKTAASTPESSKKA